MSDPAASLGRPSYWAECEAMSFGELREFVDRCLDAVEEGSVDGDQPQTKEEFLALADMLELKIEAIRAAIPEEPPGPAKPPGYAYYMSRYFEPTAELRAMERNLEELQERREEVRYDMRETGRAQYNQLQREIGELRKRIKEREAAERESYPRRYAAYLEAEPIHARNIRRWRAELAEIRKKRESLVRRADFVQARRRRIETVFKFAASPSTKGIRWRLLPPGKVSREGLRRHYHELSKKNRSAEYDQDRIEKAMDLNPKELHEEIDAAVEGYIVFTFEHTSSVLLECPRVGNAIYVVHRDWEIWSRMSKQELMADDSGAVVRIPHRGDWHAWVKRELEIE